MSVRLFFAIVALIVLASLASQAWAATPAQAITLQQLQTSGWVPAWVDATDKVWVVEKREGSIYYIYVCLEDSALLQQKVIRIKRASWRNTGEGRTAFNLAASQFPISPEMQANCFTSPPPPICQWNPNILASDNQCVDPTPVTTYLQVDWTLPTTLAGTGAPIPSTGTGALKATQIEYGPCTSADVFTGTTKTASVPVPGLRFLSERGPLGRQCARVKAELNSGDTSVWSAPQGVTLAAKPL